MNKRLLILGTPGNLNSWCKARARGIYTIVCDGYPDGPARAFADESYVIPVTDTDRIAALCKEKNRWTEFSPRFPIFCWNVAVKISRKKQVFPAI